VDKIKVIFSFS